MYHSKNCLKESNQHFSNFFSDCQKLSDAENRKFSDFLIFRNLKKMETLVLMILEGGVWDK
jgi:hypothetical protein